MEAFSDINRLAGVVVDLPASVVHYFAVIDRFEVSVQALSAEIRELEEKLWNWSRMTAASVAWKWCRANGILKEEESLSWQNRMIKSVLDDAEGLEGLS